MKKRMTILLCGLLFFGFILNSSRQVKLESAKRTLYDSIASEEQLWAEAVDAGDIGTLPLFDALQADHPVVRDIRWDEHFGGIYIVTEQGFMSKKGFLLTRSPVTSALPLYSGEEVCIVNETDTLCVYELAYYWD